MSNDLYSKRFQVINVFSNEILFESNYYLECLAYQERNDNDMRITKIYSRI